MGVSVFIAASIDGYIADREGSLDWLQSFDNPEGLDLGFSEFISRMDAVVMGRKTFESVCEMGIPWPYEKPVFVLSSTLEEVPPQLSGTISIISGGPEQIIERLRERGFENLYIDGGNTIQRFLERDLIEELTITTIPILLGGGTPLFGSLSSQRPFRLVNSVVQLEQLVTTTYRRR